MDQAVTGIKDNQAAAFENNVISGINPSYSIGIDIGYSSVKIALVDDYNDVVYTDYVLHKGKIREKLTKVLARLSELYETGDIIYGGITGSESRILSPIYGKNHVKDIPALIEGCTRQEHGACSIMDIGGENARYITGFGDGSRSNVEISMNPNCSAGTGSFLEEQVSRLNLDIGDYSACAAKSKTIPRIAGRCSVFAKTDIIHHQQEGVPVEDILQGLAYALVRNYRGAVVRKLPVRAPVVFTGGVALNEAIEKAIKDVFNLGDGELIVPGMCAETQAIGAAIIAKKDCLGLNLKALRGDPRLLNECNSYEDQDVKLPALGIFGNNDSREKHICKPFNRSNGKIRCFLGVDTGSTSTNLVLIDEDNEIIAYRYLRTLGDPVKAVFTGLRELGDELTGTGDNIEIAGVGTTGSGRYMIARTIGADVIKDEITAQAKAASTIDNTTDTIFEIGGQDSKFISLNDGRVTDFQMNKICAAGTGSFIEEQSNKFEIPIDEFGEIALKSKKPVNLGERCTVFIETSIASRLAGGTPTEDIVSGLCYSIAKNYLNRVVGQKKIGDKIFLQGGIAYNQGVVNAFRALTGKEVTVPPFFSVTGAYGSALLTKEEIGTKKTGFKGFYQDESGDVNEASKEQEPAVDNEPEFSRAVNDIIFEGYDGKIDPAKKTIGMPRALFTYGMYPMFSAFFRALGYNVVLSDPTNEETVRLGQEYSLDETCYPVKLVNGHVAELMNKNVDYIFFPDLYTVLHPGSHSRQDFGCPYMQLAFKLVNRAMELDKKGIKLLSPTIGFSLGEEFMKKGFMDLGRQLDRSPEETGRGLGCGMEAFNAFEKRVEEKGREMVKDLKPDEKAFVLISKTYGVADPALNLGIPEKLKEMGYKVLAFYNLPESDISKEHPNMFWPFGQHILEAAQVVRSHPNLYAIFLTHHGCGPDTVFTHYFRDIMGDKPYLNIEIDEHSSGVGVTTRLEAFVNSLRHISEGDAEDMNVYPGRVAHNETDIKTDISDLPENARVYIPNVYPYSQLFCEFLKTSGIDCRIIPETDGRSLDEGRKHIMTNEYLSMTALIGDVLSIPGIREHDMNPGFIYIPQAEGAEVDGQYNRMIRTVLDRERLRGVGIIAPYYEDLISGNKRHLDQIFLILVAGDLIRTAHYASRDNYLKKITRMIDDGNLNIESLLALSKKILSELRVSEFKGAIFAGGELFVLYNDYLNAFTFREIEDKGYRVAYAPLSECMWHFWTDIIKRADEEKRELLLPMIDLLESYISEMNISLEEMSPFEDNPSGLIERADASTGYYAGAFGRYRESKILGEMKGIDGIINVSSLYENTAITLNTLHKGFDGRNSLPVLNLSFDGNENENDKVRIESFLYYL
ncbi:CoA-substrate-specific enzyme activase [Methanolacinia petrolearia DSM 11571]|uniref:CoA-substrate-specific enzyme activase n=1 Tax=Methanolacinia petrolearia (strain DSM 11571 / OCM 486 / SEBR 4847) TaxID=679926 RepID=E1RG30_METP4|nr:acyl-CoA dehydratase activase [Methanolacinia petrolearia]ADN36265.1 CoA-substrate-specific enzyme activase [Methanolacinia petrolearia DSM 11571]